MMLVVCADCALAVRILGAPDVIDGLVGPSSSFWPDKYPCPECTKLIQGFLELEVDPRLGTAARILDLSPEEAFAAFHGLGLPTEAMASLETIRTLLTTLAVKKVVGRNILGTTRCVLDQLILEDGTRVYLGAGAAGACAYRVVRPHSYVERFDEQSDTK